MQRLLASVMILGTVLMSGAGCCTIQGVGPCGSCGPVGGSCAPATCGPGPLASLMSCRGACGEVYVDEWISEPPVVDNCGYDCGGCGNCGQCQPIRNVLRLLWGRPYITGCPTSLCGPSCGGCDSACGCDSHSDHGMMMVPSAPQPIPATEVPMEVVPETTPTPAPAIAPTSAKRLNPARNRSTVRRVSTR